MLIWFIEDDLAARESSVELLQLQFPEIEFKSFAFSNNALVSTGSPDLIIADVAAMSLDLRDWRNSMYPIRGLVENLRGLVEKHPHAIYGFYSGVEEYARAVVTEFEEEWRASFQWTTGFGDEYKIHSHEYPVAECYSTRKVAEKENQHDR